MGKRQRNRLQRERKARPPACLHCQQPAVLSRSSAHLYGGRDFGPVWECVPCRARVGCHPGTSVALGSPCNAATRTARQAAHAAFDPLWRAKMAKERCHQTVARSAAYQWLAVQLGVPPETCHIGMMDAATARRVVAICRPHLARLAA